MNIGAGRIVYQDLTRIDAAIEERLVGIGTIVQNQQAGKLHLWGTGIDSRANVTLAERYLLGLSVRRDGSSRNARIRFTHGWLRAITVVY